MTRLWIAIVVLAAVIGWCFVCANAVSARIAAVQEKLTAAQACVRAGDYEGAETHSKAAEDDWQSNQKLLGMVLRHDEADGVTANLAELCAFAETQDADEFLAVSAATIRQLEHIRDMEYPLPENVL